MRFDRYVRYISEHRRTPEGVSRPSAIRLGAAEGYLARHEGRSLSAPSEADVQRRAAHIQANTRRS
ncbi:hypothetical protein OJ997_05475 [Solirubrobacter phytolaccae]|uniref:Uncharacterized protein n=1 Tax=Solirubrobacter phytolaccae TaxID=1404360 RepID=A0A9X3S6B0_9ACTN|nr:hypothetical protein [Solirubrobacter phytolaccae]MDA0179734.1 hypothetical protein [Solirubrobacter phytolaccae]